MCIIFIILILRTFFPLHNFISFIIFEDEFFLGRHGSRLQDHLQRRLDERKQRQRGRIGMVRHAANTRARLNQRAAAGSAQSSITKHIVSKSQISSSSNNLIGTEFLVMISFLAGHLN